MLFNSVPFIWFFPAVCVIYFCIPSSQERLRNLFLLVASYYFYMNWEPVYALLLLTSTIITFLASLGIEACREKWKRKVFLVGSLVSNLSILALFKYYDFLAANLESLLSACGLAMHVPSFGLLLPVGISFYTFQALGYTIDVYRGTTKAERDLLTYALFVSFFPQLVAGPIERSGHLLPQFRERHVCQYEQVMAGLKLMVWGYFLKLVLADRCGLYVDTIFSHVDKHNGGSYLLASLLFPFQIYGDFAGYSCIAIGASRILGFRLMDNFRRPYFARTVGEFWHRWHISLSTWFRDYVYIPLGGNRVGHVRLYFNLMVTFVVSGLWHGANWTFLCWGALHGLFVCLERLLGLGSRRFSRAGRLLQTLATFLLVSIAWILFRADSVSDFVRIVSGIFNQFGMPYVQDVGWGVIMASFAAIAMVLAKDLTAECDWKWVRSLRGSTLAQCTYLAALIALISLLGVFGSNQFIYFQF